MKLEDINVSYTVSNDKSVYTLVVYGDSDITEEQYAEVLERFAQVCRGEKNA